MPDQRPKIKSRTLPKIREGCATHTSEPFASARWKGGPPAACVPAVADMLESRRGTDDEPTNSGRYCSVSSPDSHLAAFSATSRTDTKANRTQPVVVLDCVDSLGELHWTVDTRLHSVARCGQKVRSRNVCAKNISGRSCLLLCLASSFPRPDLPKCNRSRVGSPTHDSRVPQE